MKKIFYLKTDYTEKDQNGIGPENFFLNLPYIGFLFLF